MNEVREGTGPIEYVREKIPEFAIPEYDGQRYEAMVPDTLDLQERAELAVNGLTGPTDPQADYEIYWKVSFQSNPPWMQHDWSDGVQVKFMEALPLMRVISGSDLNQHVDHRWMEVALHTLGPDGLSYTPARGRPWARLDDAWGSTAADHFCIPSFNGRLISTMTIYHLRGSNPVWKEAIERMVQGLTALAVDKGSYAYFPEGVFSPDVPRSRDAEMPVAMQASLAGWVVQGLAQYYRISGHEPARELADKLTRYLQEHAGLFDTTEGFRFLPTNPGGLQNIHFHHHTNSLLAMAELALGTRNESLLEYVRQGYEYCKVNGNVLVGFFAEDIGSSDQETSEPCDIADMLAIGLKLTEAGAGDYWDDVDRWTRNQFVETQLLRTDWIDRMVENLPVAAVDKAYQTADGTPERNVGAFLSWPSPNDGFTGKRHGLGIMHCCTGNAARAIYYVWQNILRWEDGKLRVNLLLNRASAWADVDSHIPYEGPSRRED